MRVVNVMLSRGAGGIEQVLVEYCRAQRLYEHSPIAITHPKAWVNSQIKDLGVPTFHLNNFGEWDPLASKRLHKQLAELKPDVVIAHANRALSLCFRAAKDIYPLVGVANNYRTRRFTYADAAFAPTHDLVEEVIKAGVPRNNAFYIPNMIDCKGLPTREKRHHPPVIGTMGRFVAKKGFEDYLRALANLRERGFAFQALLGGTGEEEKKLRKLAEQLKLHDRLQFIGWVDDREEFYRKIDLFVLPSLHEPFGIVLLEAFSQGVPVISTNTEGPRDIITADEDAIIVPKGNPEALADGIATLLIDETRAGKMAMTAFTKARTQFSLETVGDKMNKALISIKEKGRK